MALLTIVKELEKRSKTISSDEEIAQIGTISANGEIEIGGAAAALACGRRA